MRISRSHSRSGPWTTALGLSLGLSTVLGAIAGCGDSAPLTQLVVEVDTDFSIPAELNGLRIKVLVNGNVSFDSTHTLGMGSNPISLPARLTLIPRDEGNGTFTVEADGLRDDTVVVKRTATLGFVRGQSLVLRIDLLRECRNVVCAKADETCIRAGTCVPDGIDPSTLPRFDPNKDASPEPNFDAAADRGDASDARRDAGDGAVDGMICDGGAAGATCSGNPGAPCREGRISCVGGAPTCLDGPNNVDGTTCGSNKLCSNGACVTCAVGLACATNSDPCTSGATVCNPAGCSNGATKSPGASCGAGQVCSAAGTCIPCAAGALCAANAGAPCKKGAIACASGAPQCTDDVDASDGTSCGPDKVCKAGACVTCAAGTVCASNPGGACKLGVVACGAAPGCIDGDDTGAGTACGSNMVCNGNGQCVTCAAGQACSSNPGSPCKTGVIDCAMGAPRCLDSSNTAAGTSCGSNQVCNGSGTCVSCMAGQASASNPSICRNGVTSCVTGASTCIDGMPKSATTACTGGQMCDGNGFCGACVAGQSCTGNPNACKQGTATCSAGATTCSDGANRSAGSGCGVGRVCDGAGACVACAAGQACTGNPSACKNGATSCSTGAQTCADGSDRSGGASCGTNMVCNGAGACAACTANANCSTNPTACMTGITSCATGTQVCTDFGNRSAGTACGTGKVCDGSGACVACNAGQSCTGNPGACFAGVTSCASGAQMCVDGAAVASGTGCGTNQVCNAAGQCALCTAGQACATNPRAACFAGVTSCATGVQTCVDGAAKTPGTACGGNMVCNGAGGCVACTAGSSCTGNSSSCKSGVISCATGAPACVDGSGNVAGGTPCGSNQVCDGNGFCGMCSEGQSCSGNPNPCYNGIASCMTGAQMCANGTAKAAGTGCGANMVCSSAGSCIACTAGVACGGNPSICKNGTTSCATGAQTCADATNKTAGLGCGANMVCNGAGTCVACTAGAGCTANPSICKNGATSCATGAQTCVDDTNVTAGTGCGSNLVCNGAGGCVACTASQACTANPSICKNGATSCATGAQTCADATNKAAGTGCGSNLVCNGAGNCVACAANQACTGNPTFCKNGTTSCATGVQTCSDGGNKPGGTTCGTNMVCDGNGNCGACTANQSCGSNPNPCTTGITSCSTGTQMCLDSGPKAGGTGCGVNMVCNGAGGCVACTANQACAGNPSVCKNGTTSCATGTQTCLDSGNKALGASCGTNLACDGNGTCKQANGVACATGSGCASGNCVDGYCCDGSCTGKCQACDVNRGVCTTVGSGQPHGARGPCAGTGVCQGTCNGSSPTSCGFPIVVCAAPFCNGSLLVPQQSCDGAGSCPTGAGAACPSSQMCQGSACVCMAAPPGCGGGPGTRSCTGDTTLITCSSDAFNCVVGQPTTCQTGQYCWTSTTSCAAPTAVGYPTSFGTTGTKTGGYLLGQTVTISATSTVRSFGLLTPSAASLVSVGLYTNSGTNLPSQLVAKTEFQAVVVGVPGKNEYAASPAMTGGSLQIAPGTYWIMALFDVNTSTEVAPAGGPLTTVAFLMTGWGSALPQMLSGVSTQAGQRASNYYINVTQ